TGPRNRKKELWGSTLSGSWIEASSDNFLTTDTLSFLSNYNSFREEYVEFNNKKFYKEIRYRCGPKTQIASLKFYDGQHNQVKGDIVHNLGKGFKSEKVFDNDMLTWVWIGNSMRFA